MSFWIDGHGGAHLIQRDPLEKSLHICEGIDGHPHLAHLALGQGVVRIVADLGGQIKGHAQPRLAMFQEILVAFVGFFGAGKTGILAHGPEPAPIHGGLHPAGVRKISGKP